VTVLVDEALAPAARQQVEALVRAVVGLHPRPEALVVSVIRLGAGRWNVFVSESDAGQFSLLPTSTPLAAFEEQIQKGLEGIF
jgi:hypothetical protein